MIIIKTLYYEKRIYYVVGITVADTDLYYPIMNMLSGFLSSEYAHNYRMYAHGNSYKMITDPVNDRLLPVIPTVAMFICL